MKTASFSWFLNHPATHNLLWLWLAPSFWEREFWHSAFIRFWQHRAEQYSTITGVALVIFNFFFLLFPSLLQMVAISDLPPWTVAILSLPLTQKMADILNPPRLKMRQVLNSLCPPPRWLPHQFWQRLLLVWPLPHLDWLPPPSHLVAYQGSRSQCSRSPQRMFDQWMARTRRLVTLPSLNPL